jgi:GNAT superfamily N-acetyltransferase
MFTIRPFEATDADYAGFVALGLAVWPDQAVTVEERKHSDQTRDPKYLFQRFLVEADGTIVASGVYCEPWWAMKPGKYRIDVSVHPDYRRRGIGTALYNHLMERLAEHKPAFLSCSTREDQVEGLRFLAKRGFEQVMRAPISHLDVPGFDPAPFSGVQAKVESLGIKIMPLAELATMDENWKRKLWDIEWELIQDVPMPDPPTRQTFENYEERVLGNPGFAPDGQFVALGGDQWVGVSGLWTSQATTDKLYTGLTGVVRSHRRKGIATAMKVRAIGFAQEYGAKVIETDNEENNPMHDLNMKLGFKPQPAWLILEKRMRETGEGEE